MIHALITLVILQVCAAAFLTGVLLLARRLE